MVSQEIVLFLQKISAMRHYSNLKSYFPILIWPLLVFMIHMLIGNGLGVYYVVRWFDIPMHFLGGAAIGLSSFYLFAHLERKDELRAIPIVKVFLAMAITALAAVLWEFSEYASDNILGTMMQPSIFDTLKDLAMGLLGVTIVNLIYRFRD